MLLNHTQSMKPLNDEDIYINSKKEVIGVVDEKIAKNFLKNIDINKIKKNPQIYTKLWNQNIECNNIVGGIFVIMICPISRLKSFPVHIIVNQNGFATNVIDQRLKDVSKKFAQLDPSQFLFLQTPIHIIENLSMTNLKHGKEIF